MYDTPNRELSVVGRWLSPDPAGTGWNQYSYPTNPNSATDPTGLIAKIAFNNPNSGNVNGGECSYMGYAMSCADVQTLETNGAVALTAVPADSHSSAQVVTSTIILDGPFIAQYDQANQADQTNAQEWAAFSMVFGTFAAADPFVQAWEALSSCTSPLSCGAALGMAGLTVVTDGGSGALSVDLSDEGLATVANHLAQFGEYAPNTAMLQRLQDAFDAGQSASGADANFYLHELYESQMMVQGASYDAAHAAALDYYSVSPYSLFAPEVIQANPQYFNNNFRAYWGLSLQGDATGP